MYYLGIDVGGTNISAGLFDRELHMIRRIQVKTHPAGGNEAFISTLRGLAHSLCRLSSVSPQDVSSIGIALPGMVRRETREIVSAFNLSVSNLSLGGIFEPDFPAEVFIENDANAAAICEMLLGAAKECSDFLIITVGTGIGMGIVTGGRLYIGANGAAGEAGHMTVEINRGRLCTCGRRGCFEAYASVTGLIALTREAMEEHPESRMWAYAEGMLSSVSGQTAFSMAKAGDKAAADVVELYVGYLASGIASLINIFDPELVLIGGGISREGSFLLDPLAESVGKTRRAAGLTTPLLRCADFAADAGIIGAAALSFYQSTLPEVKNA